MKWRTVLGAAGLVCATALITSSVVSQDPPGDGHDLSDPAMARWYEYMTPGEHHARLMSVVGTWQAQVRSWHAPEGEPHVMDMNAEYKSIMDGRFLQGTYHGTFPGGEFRGMDIMGYDNLRKEYVSIWLDNMSTGVTVSYGTYDPEKEAIVMKGTHSCPMTGDPNRPIRSVTQMGDDKSGYTMYSKDERGREYKSLEVQSRRKSQ